MPYHHNLLLFVTTVGVWMTTCPNNVKSMRALHKTESQRNLRYAGMPITFSSEAKAFSHYVHHPLPILGATAISFSPLHNHYSNLNHDKYCEVARLPPACFISCNRWPLAPPLTRYESSQDRSSNRSVHYR